MTAWPSDDDLDAVASACGFLSHVFLRAEAGASITANLDADTAADWPLERDPDTAAGVDALVRAVTHPATDADLVADHTRLFVGPGRMAACPWESVHRSEEGLTFEEDTLAVRAAYAEVGLQAPQLNREPDDHIGLELAFVGELAVAALDARAKRDTEGERFVLHAAARFHDEHLGVWAGGFADLVVEAARTDLYRAAGLLLRGALPQFTALLPRVLPLA